MYIAARDGAKLFVTTRGSGAPSPSSMDGRFPPTAGMISRRRWQRPDTALLLTIVAVGRSEQTRSGYDFSTRTDDLVDVMKATDATDNVAPVGFSVGGGEVARYMSRHGGQGVSKAVLISSVVPYLLKSEDNPDGVPQAVLDEVTASMKEDRAHFVASFMKQFYGNGLMKHPVSKEMQEWSRAVAMSASLKATLDCAKASATTDFRPDLASFRCPTFIIHGTGDKTVPIDPTARMAAKKIPNARLIEYEGEPPGLFASAKERFVDDLEAFLAD